ncbi:MAG: hypothetical protein WC719_00215 [Patescibacteria group bacterium]|jgi:hypothetical protein
MKKMILSMLLLIAITSYASAKTTEEVIVIKQGDYYSEYVLNHYKNDYRLTFTRGIKKFDNSALSNLNIPEGAWPEIKADGDQIFSLNHYYDTKKIEALNQEIAEKKETIHKQNLWLFITIISLAVTTSLAIRGAVARTDRWTFSGTIIKFNRWKELCKFRPYRIPLKMLFGGSD